MQSKRNSNLPSVKDFSYMNKIYIDDRVVDGIKRGMNVWILSVCRFEFICLFDKNSMVNRIY